MQTKERLFYLDFIRAVATILIVVCHYDAIFAYAGIDGKYVLDINLFNIYIGEVGVSLFLIISGCAIMYVYEDSLNLRQYFKKRFLNIYPMFWLSYMVAFFFKYLRSGAWKSSQIPKIRIFLSLIGFDGLFLTNGVSTFYILGEWFLGFIIIFYLLFPLLRKELIEHPVILAIITSLLYITLHICYPFKSILPSTNILIRLPELLFGMYFVRYIKKIPWYVALISLLIVILNSIFRPKFNQSIQTTYIGICVFLLLAFVAASILKYDFFKNVRKCTKYICKYSYAIFLVHHVVIFNLMQRIDISNFTRLESHLVFLGGCCVINVFAIILYFINDLIVEKLILKFIRKTRSNHVDKKLI